METIPNYPKLIRKWNELFHENPQCDLGSDLHSDSLRYPIVEGGANFNAGKMVVRALDTGAKTLDAMVELEKQQKRKGINVPGLSVLSRTAMVSAALAIWLLHSDDDDVRLEHGLLLSRENVRQLKALPNKDGIYTKTVDPRMTEVATSLRTLAQDEIAAIETTMVNHGFNPKRKVSDSDILFEAAEILNEHDENFEDYRKPVVDAWRVDSGFAHALAWPYELAFAPDPADFLDEVIAAPVILTQIAVKQFDKRRINDN